MRSGQATTILRKEHDAILQMLDMAEEVARWLDHGERVAPETLSGLLEILQVFADRCHHTKEEDLLFPLLEKRGLPRDRGPIGVMLFEHEQGRGFMRQMAESAEAYARGAPGAGPRWAAAARGYAELLRQHIFKENNILFRMAEQVLTAHEQEELAAAFDEAEEEKIGAGKRQRIHRLMDKLTAEIF